MKLVQTLALSLIIAGVAAPSFASKDEGKTNLEAAAAAEKSETAVEGAVEAARGEKVK